MTRCKVLRRFGRAVALILATGVVLAGARPLAAQPAGTAFTYQGRLSDSGTPVTGAYDLQCALFTASAGGTQVGSTLALGDVAVASGLFTVNLDFGPGAFAGSARFLETGVRPGASTGAYTLLGARQELKPSPQAVFSQTSPWAGLTGKPAGFADDVDNDSGGDITSVTVGTGLTGGAAAGAVSLGLDFPAVALNHNHFGQTWNGALASGLDINNSAASGAGLRAASLGTTGGGVGVFGVTNSSAGVGVDGASSATTGLAVGIRGVTGSPTGRAVYGLAVATASGNSAGVFGEASGPNGDGVHGISLHSVGTGAGVSGQTSAANGYGVYGQHASSVGFGGAGVFGNTPNQGYGVLGGAGHPQGGIGVYGVASGTEGDGVRGTSSATAGPTTGVYGETFSTGGRAVWGSSAGVGHAGFFTGAVNVVGTLSKSAGSFKIDHPLDPENKYLYHSFVESPEMMNVYTGNVTTDADGFATVTLPDWFEALNRDFRYQLTVLDDGDSAGFVQVKVTRKIDANRFAIRTSAPRVEVSWLVTGVRKDAYAEKHRIPVEEWKPAPDRGTYIHPEDWGQPEGRGEDWKRRRTHAARPLPAPPDTSR